MDSSRFDDLTKALATSTSRRQALKTIAAATIGSALGLAGIGTAYGAPKCHRNGLGCDTNSQCCSGYCDPITSKCAACTGIGQTCTSDSQCCGSANFTAGCGNPSTFSTCPNQTICCLTSGQPTSNDCNCCSGESFIDTNGNRLCGCFTAGTLIAMADGTSRPIEHIQAGDLVLGNAGRVNRVTDVLLPVLGQRPLYALNGSGYFVTSGHPFMTEEGWKAIDPAATPAEHAGLHVGQLTVGDRLLTLTAAALPVGGGRTISGEVVDMRIETVVLQGLVGQPADPATQLYNLRLDGDHTYFANDLLVHNK